MSGSVITIVFLLAGVLLFLGPTLFAAQRRHHQTLAIFMVNLLAAGGFFFWPLGAFWIAAVIWACTAVRRDNVQAGT